MRDRTDKSRPQRGSRIGLALFVPYCLMYAGFVGLAVLRPDLLRYMVGPLNVALAYGIALIASALALAVVYVRLCASRSES